MNKYTITPGDIRRLHNLIENLEGDESLEARAELHGALDAMAQIACDSGEMELPKYESGLLVLPVSKSGYNMAIIQVPKDKFVLERDAWKKYYPFEFVEEDGGCFVVVAAVSVEISKTLAREFGADSFIYMKREEKLKPKFGQYIRTRDGSDMFYIVQQNTEMPVQDGRYIRRAITRLDSLMAKMSKRQHYILESNSKKDQLKERELVYFMREHLGSGDSCAAVADWLQGKEVFLVKLPEQEARNYPLFDSNRFELAIDHLGYGAIRLDTPECAYAVLNIRNAPDFAATMQGMTDSLKGEKILTDPMKLEPSLAEVLVERVLRYGDGEYYHTDVLNEKGFYPVNAKAPKKMESAMREAYFKEAIEFLKPITKE